MDADTLNNQTDSSAEWGVYYAHLSAWTMEYVRTMVVIASVLVTGQIVLITQKAVAHPYIIVIAFLFTGYTLMFALLTMLTTRNSLYLITRDAAEQENITEPRFDPFKTESNKWFEKLHYKTAWRHHLNYFAGMITLLSGIGLTLISVAIDSPLTK